MAAGDVNKVILVGRVTRGAIIKPTRAGVPQAVFGLSTTEVWFDKATDSKRERTTQHRVVVYGGPVVSSAPPCRPDPAGREKRCRDEGQHGARQRQPRARPSDHERAVPRQRRAAAVERHRELEIPAGGLPPRMVSF